MLKGKAKIDRVIKNAIKKIDESLKYEGYGISFYPEKRENYYRDTLKQIRKSLERVAEK